jgi:hypothetical protein
MNKLITTDAIKNILFRLIKDDYPTVSNIEVKIFGHFNGITEYSVYVYIGVEDYHALEPQKHSFYHYVNNLGKYIVSYPDRIRVMGLYDDNN